MRAKMTVAAADRGSQQLAVGGVELLELPPAVGADRDRGDHLDPVDLVLVDQAAASNGSMSAMSSPTPASLTGTLSSDSIGITAPPFALLSSLVSARPVMGIALLNSRAWTRLDSPSTPSSTSSDS